MLLMKKPRTQKSRLDAALATIAFFQEEKMKKPFYAQNKAAHYKRKSDPLHVSLVAPKKGAPNLQCWCVQKMILFYHQKNRESRKQI
ncbi:Uncharacterised protein [Chlamydia trachomatis]|nr:Uncharacterised protein [Chlamydia trachomatis]